MSDKMYVGGGKRPPSQPHYRTGGAPQPGNRRNNDWRRQLDRFLSGYGGVVAGLVLVVVVVALLLVIIFGLMPKPGGSSGGRTPVAQSGSPTPSASPSSGAQSSVPSTTGAPTSSDTASSGVDSRVTDPTLSYQLRFPELYVDPVEIIPHQDGDKVIYLTFNDAPSTCTDELLQALDELGVKATFFVTCANLDEINAKSALKKIDEAGHAIGIYTYSGNIEKIYASVDSYLSDFKTCDDIIYSATGKHATLFRFPGGSGDNAYNNGLSDELIAEMTRRGYVYHDWNVDCNDTSGSLSVEELMQTMLDGCANNDKNVILLDNGSNSENTVEAVRHFVRRQQEDGYRFAALDGTVKPFTF